MLPLIAQARGAEELDSGRARQTHGGLMSPAGWAHSPTRCLRAVFLGGQERFVVVFGFEHPSRPLLNQRNAEVFVVQLRATECALVAIVADDRNQHALS